MNKKKNVLAACLLLAQVVFAQSEFKKDWETKVEVENKWNSCNGDLSMILIGDLKSFAMVDGLSGKTLWTFNAKERVGVKSVEDWTFLWAKEGEPVEVIYKKPKEDTKVTIYLDPKTGVVNNSITESTLKDKANKVKRSKNKTRFAGWVSDEASSTYVELFYKDKLLKNSSSGNEFEVSVKASGGNTWSTNLKVKAVTHINRLLLSDDEPSVMMNLMVRNGKVFVIYEGISVLDLKTGSLLWTTTFDMVDAGMTSQEIGKCPMPTVDNDAVYLCDLSKGEKAIKKLDINTGTVLWKSEKLDKDEVISQLSVVNNVLIAKAGGYIRKAKSVYNPNNGATTQIAKNVYEGTPDIRAYDAASGKLLWSAENLFKDDKFSKSQCTILLDGDKLVACSAKNIYYLDPQNGKVFSKTELGKEIGKPEYIFEHNGNYIVEGEGGLASFSKAGAKNYATNTKKRLFTEFRGEAFVVWTGKEVDDMNEFICFDLNSGKILGTLKGCYSPRFNVSGSHFIRFKDETITRYQTGS